MPLTPEDGEAPGAPAEEASQETMDLRRAVDASLVTASEQTLAANSQIGRAIQESLMCREQDREQCFLLEYTRTPVEYHTALHEDPELVQSAAPRKP